MQIQVCQIDYTTVFHAAQEQAQQMLRLSFFFN